MALERVPADIRREGGVARMVRLIPLQTNTRSLTTALSQSDPKMIREIIDAVTIPVMAKCRIGHFVEAQARAAALSLGRRLTPL
jgi:pyridoxal 5'-phosphate synthase pdxS subunit